MFKAVLSKTSSSESSFGKSFRDGLSGGAALFFLFFIWMFLRGPDTADKMQSMVPFQTASLEEAKPEVKTEPEDPSLPSQKTLPSGRVIDPLPPAPVEGLSENVDGRILPIMRMQDDLTPFQAYKAPFTPMAGKTQVSLVILDFGLSSKISQSLLDNLPPEISLVLSAYADDPSKWAATARAYGHEFWIDLPMQRKDDSVADAGPDAILASASFEENQTRVQNLLSRAIGYVGFVTSKNHTLSSEDVSASTILKQIYGRGLAIAESNPEVAAYGLSYAMESGYPYVQNNFWIDESLDPASIDRALAAVELQANLKGKAIAFLHPYPVVIKRVQEWIAESEKRGVQIAPLSAMAQ